MSTSTISRILLTVLVAAAMAPSLYWIAGGRYLYGGLLLFGGAAILVWVWWPRKKEEKDTR